jgi:hypothetical protein
MNPDRDLYCTGQVLNLIIGGRDVRSAILNLSQVSAGMLLLVPSYLDCQYSRVYWWL